MSPTGADETRAARRATALSARTSLSSDVRTAAERRIAELLLSLPELSGAGLLGTYLPTHGEADPNVAVPDLRSRGWEVHAPVVGDDRSMTFAPWDAAAVTRPNRFGIAEPEPASTVRGRDLDAVLVPCVGLDRRGNRLGSGHGFYDRAFASRIGASGPPVLIGVAFDVQLLEQIDPSSWDVPVDVVVTDLRVERPAP